MPACWGELCFIKKKKNHRFQNKHVSKQKQEFYILSCLQGCLPTFYIVWLWCQPLPFSSALSLPTNHPTSHLAPGCLTPWPCPFGPGLYPSSTLAHPNFKTYCFGTFHTYNYYLNTSSLEFSRQSWQNSSRQKVSGKWVGVEKMSLPDFFT